MGITCCVFRCGMRSGKDLVKFFRFPKLETRRKPFKKLAADRQRCWLKAINRKDLKLDALRYSYVCSRHFVSGKSSALIDNLNVDWVPTQNLGYVTNTKAAIASQARYKRTITRDCKKAALQLSLSVSQNKDNEPGIEIETLETDELRSKNVSCQTEDFYFEEYCSDRLNKKYERLHTKYEKVIKKFRLIKSTLKHQHIFSNNTLKKSDKTTKYLTGFASFSTMEEVFKEVENALPTAIGKMNKFDLFLMTLIKIRLDLPFSFLGLVYGVSTKTISKFFYSSVLAISPILSSCVMWQEDYAVNLSKPVFFNIFGSHNPIIIDCFEVFAEKPGNYLARANLFSNYKHHTTLKYLIAISAVGSIIYISKGYGGRCSDKFIVNSCGFLDKLKEGDIVLADRGFLIHDVMREKRVRLLMPAFKNGRSQLEPLAVENSRQIARIRVHIERIIGVLRQKFLILTNRQPISAISKKFGNDMFSDYIMGIACGIVNLCPSVIVNKPSRNNN